MWTTKKWEIMASALVIVLLIIPGLVATGAATEPEDAVDVELAIRSLGPMFFARNNGDESVRLVASVSSADIELFHEEGDLTPGMIWMTYGRPMSACVVRPITATISAGSQTVIKNGFQVLFWAVVF